MTKSQFRGFNKEKFVFLLCLLLMVVSGFLFLISRPETLEDQEPVTDKKPPLAYALQDRGPQTAITFDDKDPKSPFTPVRDFKFAPTPKPPANVGVKPAPAPLPPAQLTQVKPVKSAMTPTEKDLEISFRGIGSKPGTPAVALVEKKDGTGYLRVKEGDTIEGLNYKITKIEPQAIYLTDVEGRPYVLKDGRFLDASSGPSSGSKLPKNVTGFGGSSPSPAPNPAPKGPGQGKLREK